MKRMQDLFHAAADLPVSERESYLRAACEEDETLYAEVVAMLEEDSRGGSVLDLGLGTVARRLLADASSLLAQWPEFGPYRLIRLLGEGGMGVVYLAERHDLSSQVAIKILRDAGLSPARRERFTSEQRLLARLNHPAVARLYDADVLPDGTPWFAMEYVEGVAITDYCRVHECSVEERLRLFVDVCAAVQHAHEHAVIHRDLKPSNVLVKEGGSVRLLDFGIAKQVEDLQHPADQTQAELRLLTPAYASPEQVRGAPVGVFTDVYGLGAVLYELLAQRAPFDLEGRTPAEVERLIGEAEPAKPSQVTQLRAKAADWEDLDVLCLKAMHKEPGRRYRSVEALTRDLQHYLRREPLEARPDSLLYRAGKFVRRRKRGLAVSAAMLVMLAGLSGYFTVRLAKARETAQRAAVRSQRVQQFMLNLFEGGEKEAGPANGLRVVTLLDRGRQEVQTLQREPDVQAALYETLGSLYRKLGEFSQADKLLMNALTLRRRASGDPGELVDSLVALGQLRVDQGKFDEAEALMREAVAKANGARPRMEAKVIKSTVALGLVLKTRGAYAPAIQVLDEAVRRQSMTAGPADAELANSLKELAETHYYAGHLEVSEGLNQRVLAMHRQMFGPRHPAVADDLVNLGAISFDRGRYTDAERMYREGLAITEEWYGREHPETVANLTMVGRVLVMERRFDDAVPLLTEALASRERVYGPMHPKVASVVNELASIALRRGDLDAAESGFRRMAAIYKAAFADRHYLISVALSNLASVSVERKDYAGAVTLYREALRRSVDTLSETHLNTGILRIKLGHALLKQQKYAEAEGHILAGYEIVSGQAHSGVSWAQTAQKDMVLLYDAVGKPEKAARWRALVAGSAASPTMVASAKK